ncbi:hypothetical protein GGI16_009673 [Coemansia sp. S142-1]|nr:hypothetical protein GGI16_009673 [Coemansia sp. S142-1]
MSGASTPNSPAAAKAGSGVSRTQHPPFNLASTGGVGELPTLAHHKSAVAGHARRPGSLADTEEDEDEDDSPEPSHRHNSVTSEGDSSASESS